VPGSDPASLAQQVAAINWCHPIDLGGGVVTRPQWHVRRRYARRVALLQIPADLRGKTVLDIGAWDGFFSFECERRGAARVLAIDDYAWTRHGKQGFLLAHDVLRSKVEHRSMTVEQVTPDLVGTFDLVLFLGVFYHLRSPILALDNLRRVTAGTVICETHTLIPAAHGEWPLVGFFPGDDKAQEAPREFAAIPTIECLRQMFASAGFARCEVKHTPSMRLLKQAKALVTGKPQSGRLIVHAS
jgi:tRNA (mo5U34)-methyltransferase